MVVIEEVEIEEAEIEEAVEEVIEDLDNEIISTNSAAITCVAPSTEYWSQVRKAISKSRIYDVRGPLPSANSGGHLRQPTKS